MSKLRWRSKKKIERKAKEEEEGRKEGSKEVMNVCPNISGYTKVKVTVGVL